jgi:hypothetical protein
VGKIANRGRSTGAALAGDFAHVAKPRDRTAWALRLRSRTAGGMGDRAQCPPYGFGTHAEYDRIDAETV